MVAAVGLKGRGRKHTVVELLHAFVGGVGIQLRHIAGQPPASLLDGSLGRARREKGSGAADAEGVGGDEGWILAHVGEHGLDASLEVLVGDVAGG